ncbi:MAG TPA: DNA repair protein RadC [Bacillus bacterium]|uniref:JAB domain-containing protein n=1 Tax=Siminovitchia fordii TaxID=254759 RepID=UPI00037A62E6|nr:JAB domain-containing protein [Siminovitchia fordii]HBZ09098.1 DNA repair protein RadC [Bacillus sp. (in: firmicutes)]
MKKVYEILRIKQVAVEMELDNEMVIGSPEEAAKVAASFICDEDREIFLVLCLNTKKKVVAIHRCHVGSLNASIVHPREVFKAAIMNNAASIIAAHQHPSGDVTPSLEDMKVTMRLDEAGKILGIELLDHVIVNATGEYSSIKDIISKTVI